MNWNSTQQLTNLKKDVAQLYNRVNQEIYGVGVKKQRIEISQNKLLIFAQHKRVPALQTLSKNYQELTTSVDAALIKEYKAKFKEQIELIFGLRVITILKDYDPITEKAFTIVYFKEEV
ncbi:Na-translocating system protein MpsC family protein [Neobacillus mesonae]|uniref:Na-translocating system protein MpsC family protein n=1 Tax=Neobacillus mesonae TaxID=1193713 RepID=UPI002E1A452B|nr:Na-translocating system protein MpsC family protein [Neobacillus mesonae]